ncbi:hypothetical protein [Actibacterium sp. MT2.3-13A]|uniref:hypothetical protein n=1 Tax=Actibacterium sp. MT2.3-13A TaxID=2828332 RepID=UPI001BAC2DA9|nr:hypothetical protein [Actibacterium sp. MT2.3-13A]
MITLLRLVHILAMAVGVGGGVANLIALRRMQAAEGPAKAALAGAMRQVGMAAALALALLWVSGLALVYARYDGWAALPLFFWAKIAAVVALTAVSGAAQVLTFWGMARKSPPDPALMARLGKTGAALALTATALAVLSFTD